MVGLTPVTNAALMGALIALLDSGTGAGYCRPFGGVRPATGGAPSGAPICTITLAEPCGTVDPVTGAMLLTATDNLGDNGQIANAAKPTWVRFYMPDATVVMDLDARLAAAPDLGQEVVLSATALNIGAFLRLASGGFTAA